MTARLLRYRFGTGLVLGGVLVGLVWAGTSGVFNTAGGHLNARYGQIRSVNLQPVPEGPQGPPFVPRPQNTNELPLTLVRQFLIEPLPAPLDQGLHCSGGGDLIITLNSGRQIVYGPCRWPWQISELWGAMIEAGEVVACDHGQPPVDVCGALRAARARPFQTSF